MTPNAFLSLKELALLDPVAAYGRLLGVKSSPVSFNTQLSFSSLSLSGPPITQPLDQLVSRRTWIDNITFELQLPNAFTGNIFLPQALKDLKASPGIAVRVTVMSGPRYLVSDTFTPLENFVNIIASRWTTGWQIAKNQQIKTDAILTAIPFNDSSNTPPYVCNITWNGWQFDDLQCEDVGCDEANCKLAEAGILTAKKLGVRTIYCASE